MIVARKFDHLVPPRIAARNAYGRHRRLRAGIDEPNELHMRTGGANLLGKFRLPARRRAIGKPPLCGVRDRAYDLLTRMPQHERSPAHHIVGITPSLNVGNRIPHRLTDKTGRTPDGAEGAYGRIDAARNDLLRPFKKLYVLAHMPPSDHHAECSRSQCAQSSA